MSILFTNARLIDPQNRTETVGWLHIAGGTINAMGAGTTDLVATRTIDCHRHCLAPGIVDIGVKIGEPGERHKESFRTALLAAAAGGVTTMVTRPDTIPAIDTPEKLEFVLNHARGETHARIVPMATLTMGRAGREMAEIGFLQSAGAAAFSDGDAVCTDPQIFARCLSYAVANGALVIAHVQDPVLSDGACATSGKLATKLGLPAVSAMAERMALERDLALVEMTSARYHADQISTAAALPALKRAKDAGLDVTAGVSIHHLTLNELDIDGYRTFFKIKPPLRAEEDRLAVVAALASGLIDIVSSMHTPQDEESKRLPYEEAASGAVALETFLPAALRLVHNGAIDLPSLFAALALNPARRLGLAQGRLEVGAPADLIVFDLEAPFKLDRFTLMSKSKNTPFDGQVMQGKVLKTLVGGNIIFESETT